MTGTPKEPQPIGELLKVEIVDGRYYCTCTNQAGSGGKIVDDTYRPMMTPDSEVLAALRKLGVNIEEG
jgi:hypothetical protein